jgi:cobalt-zinc-cadmium efflux system membrane fusion protein
MHLPSVITVTLVAALCVGCGGDKHEGHDHAAEAEELPAVAVTVWAERTELFMEYQPLIVGRESRFAAHVTAMPSFAAVTSGSVTLTLAYADGERITRTADAPTNPGIFRPNITPTKAGPCTMTMSVAGPQVTEAFAVGPCAAYADEAAARAAMADEAEVPGRIAYLKEQQWKTEFATVVVAERELQDGVRATGEIRAAAGRDARLGAPAAGRVTLIEPTPLLGTAIARGQVLARVAPPIAAGGDRATVVADVRAGQAEVEAARAAVARAERLIADQAAPTRTRRRGEDPARDRRGPPRRWARPPRRARPQRRRWWRWPVVPGPRADRRHAGRDRGRVRRERRGGPVPAHRRRSRSGLAGRERLRARHPEGRGRARRLVHDRRLRRAVRRRREHGSPDHGRPGDRSADPDRAGDLRGRQQAGRLRIGNFTRVLIATGPPRRALAIPESAIVDDAGAAVAYVMVEGEAFERRPLRLGVRSNGWVEVIGGIAAGEHVVTRGAYEIKLMSASGAVPAHGHVH